MIWFVRTTLTLVSLAALTIGLLKSDLSIIFMGLLFVGISILVNGRYSKQGIMQRQLRELEKLNRVTYGKHRN